MFNNSALDMVNLNLINYFECNVFAFYIIHFQINNGISFITLCFTPYGTAMFLVY